MGIFQYLFKAPTGSAKLLLLQSFLPWDLQPFYILFFNVENNNIRKVQVKGIADDEGFTHRYGIVINGDCEVYISQNIVQILRFYTVLYFFFLIQGLIFVLLDQTHMGRL